MCGNMLSSGMQHMRRSSSWLTGSSFGPSTRRCWESHSSEQKYPDTPCSQVTTCASWQCGTSHRSHCLRLRRARRYSSPLLRQQATHGPHLGDAGRKGTVVLGSQATRPCHLRAVQPAVRKHQAVALHHREGGSEGRLCKRKATAPHQLGERDGGACSQEHYARLKSRSQGQSPCHRRHHVPQGVAHAVRTAGVGTTSVS